MILTKDERNKIIDKVPEELALVKLETESGNICHIIVGDALSDVFNLVDDMEFTYVDESWVPQAMAETLIIMGVGGALNRVIQPSSVIDFLDSDNITLTTAGVDSYLRREAYQTRKKGSRVTIERVRPVFDN